MFDSRHRRVAPGARFAAPAVLAVAALLIAFPAAASAGGFSSSNDGLGLTVPGSQSAGDQYVETLPTTRGPRAPGKGKHSRKLPHGVAKKLQKLGGSDAATLKALATSPALGAPANNGSGSGSGQGAGGSKGEGSRGPGSNGKGSHEGRSRKDGSAGTSPAVPSAAIKAVDGGGIGLGWLVVALFSITGLSLGAVGYQRHRNKGTTE